MASNKANRLRLINMTIRAPNADYVFDPEDGEWGQFVEATETHLRLNGRRGEWIVVGERDVPKEVRKLAKKLSRKV